MKNEELLQRLHYARKNANLSARELSFRLDKSQQYVSKLENGSLTLTVEKLLDILDICQFPIERFFAENFFDYNADCEIKMLLSKFNHKQKELLVQFMQTL